MYHIGDVVVYGSEGVCEILELTEMRFGKETSEYFVLSPVSKAGETFYVPTSSEQVLMRMRPVITREQADRLLAMVPGDKSGWIENERDRIKAYKEILLYGTSEDILGMTHELYQHQLEQLEKGKKLHAADERFLKDARRILIDELAYVMGVSREDVMPMMAMAGDDK